MTKYKAQKVIVDGITFDSKLEAEYYNHLEYLKREGEVKSFSLQPRFLLQESFKKNGKSYKKIEYIADFTVDYPCGRREVIDIKGFVTDTAALKIKLFQYNFPGLNLKLLTKAPKKFGGGWIELDKLKKLRKVKNGTN